MFPISMRSESLTRGGVDKFHGERFAEVVLGPDAVLPVVVLAEARREEAARVAEVHHLQVQRQIRVWLCHL